MKEIFKIESEQFITKEELERRINNNVMFPYGYNRLEHLGFREEDIAEIREILIKEIKRQHENIKKQD